MKRISIQVPKTVSRKLFCLSSSHIHSQGDEKKINHRSLHCCECWAHVDGDELWALGSRRRLSERCEGRDDVTRFNLSNATDHLGSHYFALNATQRYHTQDP